jgi:hypothetical protein
MEPDYPGLIFLFDDTDNKYFQGPLLDHEVVYIQEKTTGRMHLGVETLLMAFKKNHLTELFMDDELLDAFIGFKSSFGNFPIDAEKIFM